MAAPTSSRCLSVGSDGNAPVEWAAELDRFDAGLRASGSATAFLEQWMTARMGEAVPGAAVRVRLRAAPGRQTAPDAAARLGLAPETELAYRSVWLVRGGRILSGAENWYVPERLSPAMNRRLAEGCVPFGRVVRPLAPARETFAVDRLWDGRGAAVPPRLTRHRALMRDAEGRPLCVVSETYMRSILRQG